MARRVSTPGTREDSARELTQEARTTRALGFLPAPMGQPTDVGSPRAHVG